MQRFFFGEVDLFAPSLGDMEDIILCSFDSPVLQSARPRAVDSGEAQMRTASWENVDKQMPRNTK